jgi:cholesterol oxidase
MNDYDYIIIGSGFGGAVSALRLSEKGYRVLVIEKGKWFKSEDFPKTNKNLKRWMWLPSIGFFGIFKMTFLRHVGILSGVGVGGGSLVYANTLPVPKKPFFESGSWSSLGEWEEELKPFYQMAKKMLGVSKNPFLADADLALQEVAQEIGKGSDFTPADVAVFFGEPDKVVEDPYFNGLGPQRSGCNFCGACMTGCRYNAKNTLDKNYLYLAQRNGVEIMAEQEVFDVIPMATGGFEIHFKNSTKFFKKRNSSTAKNVVFAGGVLGTVKLLLKLKRKSLPQLSDMIGHDIRTNNESLIGIPSLDKSKDFSKGIAIGSIFHTDPDSHLEPVRYGYGSTFWRFLLLPLTSGGNFITRVFNLALNVLKSPIRHFRIIFMPEFSTKTPILLFMQHLDSTLRFSRGLFGMRSNTQKGDKPTAFLPRARELAARYARIVDGEPFVTPTESLFGIPTTAHILGGAVMGESKAQGVIDKNNVVFGYPGLLVCDGSMISANPGVNPSLTITAITERAMSLIPARQ